MKVAYHRQGERGHAGRYWEQESDTTDENTGNDSESEYEDGKHWRSRRGNGSDKR